MEHELFAVCAPGLEPFTADELRALVVGEVRPEPGGVAFRGGLQVVARANLMLRTATRVLLRLGEFHARDFEQLRKRASRLSFEDCIAPGRAVRISVTCSRSRLRHTGAVAERVHLAIADRLGVEVPVAGPEDAGHQLVLVRLAHDRCTLSLDSSGALLHQRGWRKVAGKAPLRETLAAALLLASGWDGASPLADPFCGSGTIPIEAALLARKLAPGRGRRFAFMDWPGYDAARGARILAEAEAGALDTAPPIQASDRDAGAIEVARANAGAAGVAMDIAFACRAISDFEPPPGTGWIVCNPPYGVRLRGGGDLRDLYARFGAVLRRRCPGWRVALLGADARLLRASELPLEPRASWRNGGLAVEVFTGVVPGAA
ncbi:MAG TPA: class I SAM-dependent RNA methyltransferase [Myxococcota bacterium]|jgi:putative N6-adenine-specific DNA methylase